MTRRNFVRGSVLFSMAAGNLSSHAQDKPAGNSHGATKPEEHALRQLIPAARSRDLRRIFFTKEQIADRVERRVYLSGTEAKQMTEHILTERLTVESHLKASSSQRLNQWDGVFPALILVKKTLVTFGASKGHLLEQFIEPGDILFIGPIFD